MREKKKYHCQYISILFFPHTLSPFWQLQIWLFHQNRVPYSYFITFWQSSKYPLPPRCMVLTENFLYITQYLPPSIWSFIVLHLCCAINSWHLFSFYFRTKKKLEIVGYLRSRLRAKCHRRNNYFRERRGRDGKGGGMPKGSNSNKY